MQYEYDANGRMRRASLITGGGETTSMYDGLGQRVQSVNSGVTTNLVYDAFGQLIAEYNSAPVSGAGGVTYLASDSQGSIRVVMDNAGTVIGRRDYQPFGEEIPGNVGKRNNLAEYNASVNARQQYAGMEKELSGLSHTVWRRQESRAGRWTSPDPYGGSMRPINPQTFNRYSYVGNDPMNRIDPSGLDDTPSIGTFGAGNIYAGPDPATTLPVMMGSNIVMQRQQNPLRPPDIAKQIYRKSRQRVEAAEVRKSRIKAYYKCLDDAIQSPTGFEPQLESIFPGWDQIGEAVFQGVIVGTSVGIKAGIAGGPVVGVIAGAGTAAKVTGVSILWGMGYRSVKNLVKVYRSAGPVQAAKAIKLDNCIRQYHDVVDGRGFPR